MSLYIPQVNLGPRGELIPNPGENVISKYILVDYDKYEGDFYVTDTRLAWVGTKTRGGLLGKIAKAAVVAAAVGAAAYAGSKVSKQVGLPPAVGGGGAAIATLGIASMLSRSKEGAPQTLSIPYEVISDVQVGKDQQVFVLATQAGSIQFKFEHKGEANTVATVVKTQKLQASKRPPIQPPQPPQYQPPYPYQQPPPYQPPAGYPQPQPYPAQPAPRHGEAFYCPHCGAPLEPGARFCHSCGARVD